MIRFSSAERETIKPTLALDFTIRLNPPVKSIILRGEPIIFRSCSKRQRVAADHLKRCSSIIRQYGYSDRHLTSNTLAANPFLISLLVLFQDGIFRYNGALTSWATRAATRPRVGLEPTTSGTPSNRLIAVTVFLMEKVVWNRKRFVHITFFTLHIYYNIFFWKNQKRFFD